MNSHSDCARITADAVVFTKVHLPHVLLIERGYEPYRGKLALPGGHVDPGESPSHAAHRELLEETGLDLADMRQVGAYGDPGRDPRGWYVTVAYTTVVPTPLTPTAGDDAAAASWVPVGEVLASPDRLAFDHHRIIWDALKQILDEQW